MSGKRIGVVLLAAAIAWSTVGTAQTTDTKATPDQAALLQQITLRQQQLSVLRARPLPEREELTAAQKTLDAARAAFEAAKSDENEARLKNAEFKYTLAERKLHKADAEADKLSEEIEQLRQQLAASQQAAKNPAPKVDTKTAADASAQRAAEERSRRQEQELQRTKREAEAQQKEIERLKALLAEREHAAQSAAAPAKPAAVAKSTVAAAPHTAAPGPASGFYRLISREEMLQALQRLEQRLADLSTHERGGVNDVLYLKPRERKATNKDKITLRALGLEQYRGEARIEPGDYELIVGFNRWPLRIDDAERGNYIFLFDNSTPEKPQLQMYNRALEDSATN